MSATSKTDQSLGPLRILLRHAANALLTRPDCMASAASAQDAISLLKADLDTTIACALRDRNAATVEARRIPPEIWLHVWQYASFDDRVSIARVCHSWRSLAHATSKLWSDVRVHSSLHDEYCECEECERSDGQTGETNLGPALRALCLLSKDTTVSLAVLSMHQSTHDEFVDRLGRCIMQCATRIVDLEIASGDKFLPYWLLNSGGAFPLLRRLKIDNVDGYPPGFMGGEHYLAEDVRFPSLEVLESDFALFWGSPENAALRLPALGKLTSTFTDPEEIACALCACSEDGILGLDFHWRLDSLKPEIFALPSSILTQLDKVPVARISNLSAAQEETALSVLGRCRRRLLQLSYCERSVALGLRACSTLDLSAGLELHCSLQGGRVDLQVIDRHRNAVVIDFPAWSQRRAAWPNRATIDWQLVPNSLTSLFVDAALWTAVLHELPHAAEVTEITLRLADAAGLDTVCRPPNLREELWTFAPEVSLRLISAAHARNVIVKSASAERVKLLLNARTIAFDGILVED